MLKRSVLLRHRSFRVLIPFVCGTLLVSCGGEDSKESPAAGTPAGGTPAGSVPAGERPQDAPGASGLSDDRAAGARVGGAADARVDGANDARIHFVDVTRESGIDFVHDTGFDGNYWFPEIVGPGCALFDFDGDGYEDLFLVDGGTLTPDVDNPPDHRLYRNKGDGTFEDVTAMSGIVGKSYGQGCTVGDYDNDGDLDLFINTVGPNELFQNRGDGTFIEVAQSAGVAANAWATSASFGDVDQDGDLDLYVANYCLWSPAGQVPCQTPSGEPDYCNPKAFEPAPDSFFLNRGDGTFEDAAAAAGISRSFGRALGVLIADYDGDEDFDIYVANDGDPNILWLNQGDGTFIDEGLLSGSALNAEGNTEASMGVALTDLEYDGDWDLFMTHMTGETNTLYINDGSGVFEDATVLALGAPSMPFTGFGTGFFDADLDGDEDLFVVNGAVIKSADAARNDWPYEQRDQFFVASDRRDLVELTVAEAPWLAHEAVGRGASFGDIDNDGDVDIVVANANGSPRVLRNESTRPGRWLVLDLEHRDGREAIGGRVHLRARRAPDDSEEGEAAARPLLKRFARDGSFASSNDPTLFVGLPRNARSVRVAVDWPGGATELWDLRSLDQWMTLREGTGALGTLDDLEKADRLVPDVSPSTTQRGALNLTRSTAVPALPSLETVDPKVAERVRSAHERLTREVESADAWKQYGLALYADASDNAKAKMALEQAILRDPDDVRSVYLLALLEEALGAPARTRAYLEQAEELDASYSPIQVRLAALDVEEGNLAEGEVRLRAVLDAHAEDVDALVGLGQTLRMQDRSDQALPLLERAAALAPSSRGAHYELGLVRRSLGDSDGARTALETANALPKGSLRDPWIDELFEGRGGDRALLTEGNQARKVGDFERARALFEEYARLRPEDPIGWVNVAAARRDVGDLLGARDAVDRALELTPEDARSLALKGAIHLAQKKPADAYPLFVKATSIDPSLAQAWLDRSVAAQQLEDLPGAVSALESYLELRPNDAASHFRYGEIAVQQNDFGAATAAFERAAAADPQMANAHYRLGGLSLRGPSPADAIGHFERAIETRPNWVEAYLGLAYAHRAAGNTDAARQAVEQGLKLAPDSARLQQFLEQLP